MLSINNPYTNHIDPTTAPDAIIGNGKIDASLFLTILFCKIYRNKEHNEQTYTIYVRLRLKTESQLNAFLNNSKLNQALV